MRHMPRQLRQDNLCSKNRSSSSHPNNDTFPQNLNCNYLILFASRRRNNNRLDCRTKFRLQRKSVTILQFAKTKTTLHYSKHKRLEIPDLFKLSVAKFIYTFYGIGSTNHFYNYFAEIASVQKYRTRLASLQTHYLPRMKTSTGQPSLTYNGANIWSNIPENLKSFSHHSFGKEHETSCNRARTIV